MGRKKKAKPAEAGAGQEGPAETAPVGSGGSACRVVSRFKSKELGRYMVPGELFQGSEETVSRLIRAKCAVLASAGDLSAQESGSEAAPETVLEDDGSPAVEQD